MRLTGDERKQKEQQAEEWSAAIRAELSDLAVKQLGMHHQTVNGVVNVIAGVSYSYPYYMRVTVSPASYSHRREFRAVTYKKLDAKKIAAKVREVVEGIKAIEAREREWAKLRNSKQSRVSTASKQVMAAIRATKHRAALSEVVESHQEPYEYHFKLTLERLTEAQALAALSAIEEAK